MKHFYNTKISRSVVSHNESPVMINVNKDHDVVFVHNS